MAAAPSIACTTSQLNPHLSSVQRKKKASSSESSTRRTNGRERLLGMKRYGADEFVLGDSATRFLGAGGRRVERVTFRSFPRGISHQSVTWTGQCLISHLDQAVAAGVPACRSEYVRPAARRPAPRYGCRSVAAWQQACLPAGTGNICDDFGGAAVSQPPKSKARNVSIAHSNLLGAWKAPLLWLRHEPRCDFLDHNGYRFPRRAISSQRHEPITILVIDRPQGAPVRLRNWQRIDGNAGEKRESTLADFRRQGRQRNFAAEKKHQPV